MNKQNYHSKLFAVLVSMACSGVASASGFQLLEQNASGLGNAYAGSAAIADNASTIFYNPAGMTQLKEREFSAGAVLVDIHAKFNNNGSTSGLLTGDGGNPGGLAALPNGYLSWALNKDVYVGVGVGAPFGLKTEYDRPWVGAAQAILFDVKTYNVNPSVAWRVNDKISLGFGLNWQKLEAEYFRLTTIASLASTIRLQADDTSWGWNAGALIDVSPTTKVGVSYRSAIKYSITGRLSGAVNSGAKADVKLPDTLILSATQKLDDKWTMLGDLSWTGWSSIPKIDVINTDAGTVAQTLDTNFRNTWRLALGGNYKYDGNTTLKFGVAYDQTPVRGASTRLVSLPDNDRIWLSTGAQWQLSPSSKIDASIAYVHVRDSKIDNDQTTVVPSRGRVTGEFTDVNFWLLGVQYSTSF